MLLKVIDVKYLRSIPFVKGSVVNSLMRNDFGRGSLLDFVAATVAWVRYLATTTAEKYRKSPDRAG